MHTHSPTSTVYYSNIQMGIVFEVNAQQVSSALPQHYLRTLCVSQPTNLMIVRRFTVAFFQIFTKGLLELFAQIGTTRQGKDQGQTKAAQHTGQSITSRQRATVYVYDSRTVCSYSVTGSTLQRYIIYSFYTKKKLNSNILCIYLGSSTLPRATTRGTETELGRGDKIVAATSSTSLYDNVASGTQSGTSTAQGKSELFFYPRRTRHVTHRVVCLHYIHLILVFGVKMLL